MIGEPKLLTAAEALKMTENARRGHDGIVEEHLRLALKKIERAANSGLRESDDPVSGTDAALKPRVYQRLRDHGYKVTSCTDPRDNITVWSVSW